MIRNAWTLLCRVSLSDKRGVYPLDTQYYMRFTVRIVAHREIVNVLSYCILRSTLNVLNCS